LKVADYEENAKKLIESEETPFEDEEDVADAVAEKKKEMKGYVKDEKVLVHMLVKEYGITSMKTVDERMEIADLRKNLDGVELSVSLLDHRLIERDDEDKDDFVILNITDRTGDITGFIFDEELREKFLNSDPEFKDGYYFKGQTRKQEGRDLAFFVNDEVKKIDEDFTGEGIKISIAGVDHLDEYDFFAVEGIITEIDTGTYKGCPECSKSLDDNATNCDNCDFAFDSPTEYVIGSITVMSPDGAQDTEISIPPRTEEIPEDIAQSPAIVYGQKAKRENEDGEEEDSYRLMDIEEKEIGEDDIAEEDENGEENDSNDSNDEENPVDSFLGFVEDFGKVPSQTAKDYCKNELSLSDEETEEFIEERIEEDDIIKTDEDDYKISE